LEVWFPYYRLKEEGARVELIGTGSAKEYRGKYGYPARPDAAAGDVRGGEFDCIVIPGGFAPDFLRRYPEPISLIRQAHEAGKIVASICHGAWAAISAGIVRGRRMTCFSAIKDDVVNAGAIYSDSEVVVDGNLISARKPDDLPAFTLAIISALTR